MSININVFQSALRTTWCDDQNCPKKAICGRYKIAGNEKYLTVYYIMTPRKKNNSCEMFVQRQN